MTRIRLVACAVMLATATGLAAGCGGDSPIPEKSEVSSPTEIPTELPTSQLPTPPSTSKGELPAGFPTPPGATRDRVVKGAGGGLLAQFTVPSGPKAYDYWVKTLPKKGYKVGKTNKTPSGGTFALSGKGYPRGGVIVNKTSATVTLSKSG